MTALLSHLIPIITGLITIVGAAVGVTIYVAKLQAKMAQDQAQNEKDRLQVEIDGLKKANEQLEEKYRAAVRVGTALVEQRDALESELSTLADALDAERSCILVLQPVLHGAQSKELVFLTMTGSESENLRGVRVPLDSFAGEVFTSRSSQITLHPKSGPTFSSATDQVSKSITREILAVPLFYDGKCVGVAEFLNKRRNSPFNKDDQELAERLAVRLAARTGRFVEDPGNFQVVGITPRRVSEEATVLFSDISRSSRLAQQVDASVVVDIVNEYFEALGDVALKAGATIDKFMGDGFMVTFNVPKRLTNHQQVAVAVALDMQSRFAELAEKWKIFKIDPLHNRIGITSGIVQPAIMGHPQFRQPTMMGEAVNLASAICEIGTRDRNTVLIEAGVYKLVSGQFEAREFQPPTPILGSCAAKAKIYEVTGTKGAPPSYASQQAGV